MGRRISLTGIVLALGAVVSVLTFGAVTTLAFAPVEAAIAIVALIVFWRRGRPATSATVSCLLAILLLIPALQLLPLPRSVVSLLSPRRVALADVLLGSTISIPQTLKLSINAYETQAALLRLVCYMLVFLLAFEAYQRRSERVPLAGTLIGIGIFEAVFGCSQFLTDWPRLFTLNSLPANQATGTYVNRDHLAGFLEMVLPFLLARILLQIRTDTASHRPVWTQILLSPFASHLLRDIALFALIGAALIFTGSRMGFVGAVAGIVIVVAVVLLQPRRRSVIVILALTLALPLAYVFWVGLPPMLDRFASLLTLGTSNEDRTTIWRDTIALIRDYPLLGTGLGTYRWASLHYQTAFFSNYYDHAHNDYLEFAADIGIPAAVLLFAGLWILVLRVARRSLLLDDSSDKILAAACSAAMAAILIHGLADFNLQIPANAYLFSWIAGTSAALVRKPLKSTSSRRSDARASQKQMAY